MSLLNLDDLMDQKMDSVEAAPEYVDPCNGVHVFHLFKLEPVKREAKDKAKAIADGKPTEWYNIKLHYKLLETLSTENNELPPKPGSLSTEDFQFSEQGKPYLKARLLAIFAANGVSAEEFDGLSMTDQKTFIADTEILFQSTIKVSTNAANFKSVCHTQIQSVAGQE